MKSKRYNGIYQVISIFRTIKVNEAEACVKCNAIATETIVLLPHQRDKQTTLSKNNVEVRKMKKLNEYKKSVVLFSASLVLYCISMITGLIAGLNFSIDKICMYLGFSCFCLGLMYLKKSRENKE